MSLRVLGWRGPAKGKFCWRCTQCLLGLLLLAVLARNPIAHIAVEQIGGRLLGNSLSVQELRIGLTSTTISGLRVDESLLAGAPQLEIREIRLEPSVWRGLRQGIWLSAVAVREPTLHVRFDQGGNLLSRFPSAPEGESQSPLQLPFARLVVMDAAAVVHQTGKLPLAVRGGQLTIAADRFIDIRGQVTDMLGAEVRLESRIDAATLAGRSTVTLDPLLLDAKALAGLPLAPGSLATHPFRATIDAAVRVQHPANPRDLQQHFVAGYVRVSDAFAEEYGLISDTLELRAVLQDGRSTLSVAGPVAAGHLQLSANLDLRKGQSYFSANWDLADVDLEPLARIAAPELPARGSADVAGTASGFWNGQVLAFRASLAPRLSNLELDGVPVADLDARVACQGSFAAGRPLAGSLRLDAASDGVELAAIAERFAAGGASGRVGLHGNATIPLATLGDPRTYQATLTTTGGQLGYDGFVVEPIRLSGHLSGGQLEFSLPETTLAVAAERPASSLPDKLQLAETLRVAAGLESSVHVSRLSYPAAWRSNLLVKVRDLAVAGERLNDFEASCRLAEGALELAPAELRWRGATCRIAAHGDLQSTQPVEVRFTAGPIDLRHVAAFAGRFSPRPLPMTGVAEASGGFQVDPRHGRIAGDGQLTLSDLNYGGATVGDARLSWEAEPGGATLRTSSKDLFGGTCALDIHCRSLDWTRATIVASGRGVQLDRLADLAGRRLAATGTVDCRLELDSIADLQSLHAEGWLRTRNASLGGAAFGMQTTELRVRDGLASASFRGSAFEGELALDANAQLAELADWLKQDSRQLHALPVFGRLETKDLSIGAALAKRRQGLPLGGTIRLACVRDRAAAASGLLASLSISAENIRWNQVLLSSRVRATGFLDPGRLEIKNLSGQIAGGRLAGEASVQLGRNPAGRFRLSAENVNLRRAAAPFAPDAAVSGTASASISGRLGNLLTAAVKLRGSNIGCGGLAIRELRVPANGSLDIRSGRVRWQCRGGSLHLAGGTVTVGSAGTIANGLATTVTHVDIRRVDSAKVMRGKSISAGIVDGKVNLQAKRARGADDLFGRFRLELSQIQSLELPGAESFQQLVKLPTISGPVRQRDGGTIEGRLANGMLYLDRAALSKSGLLLLMDGRSTLDGRLDFDLTAFTNQTGPADGLIALADSPLMLAAPVPVGLLTQANDAIKDRVIHIHVGGTGARPTLRLQPAKNLSRDVLRFFVGSALGSQAADVALGLSQQSIRKE